MMNVMFVVVATRAFSDVIKGRELKQFFARSARVVKAVSLLHD